jgi:hypothetical protein
VGEVLGQILIDITCLPISQAIITADIIKLLLEVRFKKIKEGKPEYVNGTE